MEVSMKAIVKLLSLTAIVSLLHGNSYTQQNLEDRVTLSLDGTQTVTSAVSNGYGQHIAATGGGIVARYYLLANDGKIIYGPTPLGNALTAGDFNCAVATYGDKVMFVRRDIDQSVLQIRLYQSSDGGATWDSDLLKTYPPTVTVSRIDAVADANGVHIVWDNDSSTEVYYVRYVEQSGQFADFRNVTNDDEISGLTGKLPKVVTVGNKAVVSFVRTDGGVTHHVGASRDVDLSINPPSWEFPRWTTADNTYNISTQSVTNLNNDIHMVVYEESGLGYPREINVSQRTITGGWTPLVNVDNYGVTGEEGNYRRKMTSTSANRYMTHSNTNGSFYQIMLRTYDPATGWTIVDILDQDAVSRRFPTISSSRTGAYTYWTTADYANRYMRRKVLTMSGSITENMFWTGYNWISGDTNIENGHTVTMKGGSVGSTTTIQAGKKLYVKAGGKLIIEDGAQLVMESGAQIILDSGSPSGGILELADNALVTIPAGGLLEARAGTDLRFGNTSKLLVEGEIKALGTGTGTSQRVLFTRLDASDAWKGIIIERVNTAPKGTLTYATIEYVTSAPSVRVGSNAVFSMTNCTISNASLGLEFTPEYIPEGAPALIVQDNTFSLVANGIRVNSLSNLVIEGNTINTPTLEDLSTGIDLTNSSPKILGNDVQNFGRGLRCLTGSSPALENGSMGGYNNIINHSTPVYCKDASNANLGTVYVEAPDEGGQNCIVKASGGSYDVVLLNGSTVKAEKNYWGESSPNSAHFSVDGTSQLDVSPYLSSCGISSQPGGGGVNKGGIPSTLMSGTIDAALNERSAGNFETALVLLEGIISDETNRIATREWAISEAFACAQSIPGSRMSPYFESLKEEYPSLSRRVDFLLPHLYMYEGEIERGIDAFDLNISRFPNSEMERSGLYGRFIHGLYSGRDTSSARMLSGALTDKYPESDEAVLAAQQLEYYLDGTSGGLERNAIGGDYENSSLPLTAALHQNYPNPFNPLTTIKYDLPVDANVNLKVYDMLGREVLSLVDRFETAGYHQTTVDGTKLSSGVYFYRIRAGSFTDVKKLLLLK